MASSPTYESYCRERKATVDRHRFVESSRSMSEVVEEILEIISTDEELLRKTTRETIRTTESSFATWSLSSSAIMSTWPSGSTTDDQNAELDTVSKSIQSYTSQLFSPLYEVRPEQHNMFQENRQPLPKAGNTPKVRNLCYNLATELSYDEATEYPIQPKAYKNGRTNVSSDKVPSPKNQRAHNAAERILLSVSPLSVMTNAEIHARDTNVEVGQISHSVPRKLYVRPNDIVVEEDDKIPPIHDTKMANGFKQTNQLPVTYDDDFFARKDWMLKTNSSTDTGELSLEPLLNAYSEDYYPEEVLAAEIRVLDRIDETSSVEADAEGKTTVRTGPQHGASLHEVALNEITPTKEKIQASFPTKTMTEVIESKNDTPMSSPKTNVETDEKQDMSQMLSIQAFEKISSQENAFLQRITIDIPLTPSLLHAIDTSLMTLQSMIAKSLLGCSVLVRLEKKRISVEDASVNLSTPNEWLVVLGDRPSGNSDNGCFPLDLDACCVQRGDGKLSMDKHCIFDFESICTDGQQHSLSSKQLIDSPNSTTSKISFASETIDNFGDSLKLEPIHTTSEALLGESEKCEELSFQTGIIPPMSSSKSSEASSDDFVDKFLRAIEQTEQVGFDMDDDDDQTESFPKSFDSEQFMRDMDVRLESDLSSSSFHEDDTSISTIFQQLSMNLPSISCESNDGLDEEICALETFGAELKNELEKANDKSVLASLTSPINTQLTQQTSTCSMTTAFLSDINALSCKSSDDDLFPLAPQHVRKVHFNEQVEEFLFFAHETCGTPDAKGAERFKTDETFLDEVCNVFDDILDELSFACVSISKAMDRTRYLPKSKSIRRSSVS